MAETKIEWCDKVWNPVVGCTRVSSGCDHCYAIRAAHLHAKCKKFEGLTTLTPTLSLEGRGSETHSLGGAPDERKVDWTGVVRCCPEELDKPLHWRKPQRVFVNSMGDLFHEDVPVEFIARVWAIMGECPQLTFIILTKRAFRMRLLLDDPLKVVNLPVLPNVQLGVSVENQEMADLRIPELLQTPAAKRIVSLEPMLGPVDFQEHDQPEVNVNWLRGFDGCDPKIPGIDGVICGGESGPGARPMHPDWPRGVRDQCVAAKVPFFFKQWGEWAPDCLCKTETSHLSINRPQPGVVGSMFRCGKQRAGRLLDGREWNEVA